MSISPQGHIKCIIQIRNKLDSLGITSLNSHFQLTFEVLETMAICQQKQRGAYQIMKMFKNI